MSRNRLENEFCLLHENKKSPPPSVFRGGGLTRSLLLPGLSLVVVRGLFIAMASVIVEHGL